MGVYSYEELVPHIHHEIECVSYGGPDDEDPWNVSVECLTCGVVLMDYSHPDCMYCITRNEYVIWQRQQ